MAGELTYTSPKEFEEELVASHTPCLVDFYADWCGPCRMLDPEIEELAKKYGDQLKVIRVNTDLYPDLASYFVVRSIPTVFFFAQGKQQWHKIGFARGFLKRKVAEYMKTRG